MADLRGHSKMCPLLLVPDGFANPWAGLPRVCVPGAAHDADADSLAHRRTVAYPYMPHLLIGMYPQV